VFLHAISAVYLESVETNTFQVAKPGLFCLSNTGDRATYPASTHEEAFEAIELLSSLILIPYPLQDIL
jgi:hypothetical protein